jgi:tetratricopeptide (TPR) repeat protein
MTGDRPARSAVALDDAAMRPIPSSISCIKAMSRSALAQVLLAIVAGTLILPAAPADAAEGDHPGDADVRPTADPLTVSGIGATERALDLHGKGRYDEAIAAWTEAIRLDSQNSIYFAYRADAYSKKHYLDPAIADYTAAIRLDPDNDGYLNRRAIAWDASKKFDEAFADYTAAIGLAPRNATYVANRGYLHKEFGHWPQSLADYSAALRLDPRQAAFYDGRGWAYGHLRDFRRAIADFNESIRLEPKGPTPYNRRGITFQALSQYDKALADYTAAIDRAPRNAVFVSNRGLLSEMLGSWEKARADLERSAALYKAASGENHPEYAKSLSTLGGLLESIGYDAAARSCFEQALAIRKEVLGEKHRDYAITLNTLGVLTHRMGDCPAARAYYEQALAVRKEVLGEEHPDYALALYNLGSLLYSMQQYGAARSCVEQALPIFKASECEKHPYVIFALNKLGLLEAAAGRWRSAADFEDQARRAVRWHVARVLPGLSQNRQLGFLKTLDDKSTRPSLTLGLNQRNDKAICALSAAWLLNGKAIGSECLGAGVRLEVDRRDPQAAAAAKELHDVRQRLATLEITSPLPGGAQAHKEQLVQFEASERAASRRLAALNGRPFRDDPWIELATVRARLPTDGVLVDIARFRPFNFQPKSEADKVGPPRYVAWVTPPSGQGATQVVDLGPAAAIDTALQAVWQALHDALGNQGLIKLRGEPQAENALRASLGKLATLIWQPLAPALGNGKQVFLSPDGPLWLAPWDALPVGDEHYLIERFAVHYLVTGRDLVDASDSKLARTSPVLMADPDFDLDPVAVTAAAIELVPKLADDSTMTRPTPDSIGPLPKASQVPSTPAELKAAVASLARLSGREPTLYTGRLASEGVFESLVRPWAMVVSTRGLLVPDPRVAAGESPTGQHPTPDDRNSAAPTIEAMQSPLLRYGLLLAGCNRRTEQSTNKNDGVLTGREIVGTDLRGTEIVVLNGCELGWEPLRYGESVAGLRQAFQLAGAKSVVAGLWSSPEHETTALLEAFFGNLTTGQTKAVALRNAKLTMIKARRAETKAAHPIFWAAIILTGN